MIKENAAVRKDTSSGKGTAVKVVVKGDERMREICSCLLHHSASGSFY